MTKNWKTPFKKAIAENSFCSVWENALIRANSQLEFLELLDKSNRAEIRSMEYDLNEKEEELEELEEQINGLELELNQAQEYSITEIVEETGIKINLGWYMHNERLKELLIAANF